MTNKYVNRAKIDEKKFREMVRFFSLDLTAIQIAELSRLNRNTVNRYLTEMRRKILAHCMSTSPYKQVNEENNDQKCDYQVLLIREENDKIYTNLLQSEKAYHSIYDCFNNNCAAHQFDAAISLRDQEFIVLSRNSGVVRKDPAKLNRIKSFWGHSKSRLSKFKGLHSSTLILHTKECEFRYNNRDRNLYDLLLKIFRNDPLF